MNLLSPGRPEPPGLLFKKEEVTGLPIPILTVSKSAQGGGEGIRLFQRLYATITVGGGQCNQVAGSDSTRLDPPMSAACVPAGLCRARYPPSLLLNDMYMKVSLNIRVTT